MDKFFGLNGNGGRDFGETMEQEGQQRAETTAHLEAVSYTHLDVYKRQSLRRCSAASDLRLAAAALQMTLIRERQPE